MCPDLIPTHETYSDDLRTPRITIRFAREDSQALRKHACARTPTDCAAARHLFPRVTCMRSPPLRQAWTCTPAILRPSWPAVHVPRPCWTAGALERPHTAPQASLHQPCAWLHATPCGVRQWPRSARRHRHTRMPLAPKSARPAASGQGLARQPPPAPLLARLRHLWQPACSQLPMASATVAVEPHRMVSTQHRRPAHTANAAQPGVGVGGRH